MVSMVWGVNVISIREGMFWVWCSGFGFVLEMDLGGLASLGIGHWKAGVVIGVLGLEVQVVVLVLGESSVVVL